jgi:hypothetical protein
MGHHPNSDSNTNSNMLKRGARHLCTVFVCLIVVALNLAGIQRGLNQADQQSTTASWSFLDPYYEGMIVQEQINGDSNDPQDEDSNLRVISSKREQMHRMFQWKRKTKQSPLSRRQQHQQQHQQPQFQFQFDPTFELTATVNSGTVISVGKQATAVQTAILHGLAQRMKGSPRRHWNAMETSTCLDQGQPELLAKDEIIRQRLPQAILIGVQKGGTTALYTYLDQHPEIARCTKELYFLDEQVDKMVSRAQGIPRHQARNMYRTTMTRAMKVPRQDATKMILDLTPNYIFQSDRLPARISCVVPWVKLFCLLRHPMDRARSQYDMKLNFVPKGKTTNLYGKSIPTFDEYVRNDIAALRETGVLQDWTKVDFDDFLDRRT